MLGKFTRGYWKTVLAAGGLLAAALGAAAGDAAPSPPTLTITTGATPPVIDGKLDDAAWQGAAHASHAFQIRTRQPAAAATEMWLTTDGKHLYLGVLCHESHLAELSVKTAARDGSISQDDSLEIFLDPGTDGKMYFHLLLNAAGVQADQICRGEKRNREWNGGWRSATYVDPLIVRAAGWSAEFAIPLQMLRRQAGGGEWRFNLCRNKKTAPAEFSSWAPVQGGFHEPAAFGVLAGLRNLPPQDVFAPVVTAAQVSPYRLQDGRYSYELTGEIMNDGGKGDEVDLAATDQPAAGPATTRTLRIQL